MSLEIILVAGAVFLVLDFVTAQLKTPATCPHCHAEQTYKAGLLIWQCANPAHAEIIEAEERNQ
jgi:hypothetical protein